MSGQVDACGPSNPPREVAFEEIFSVGPDGGAVRLTLSDEFTDVAMSVEDALRLATLLVKAAQAADGPAVATLVQAQREATAVQRSGVLLG